MAEVGSVRWSEGEVRASMESTLQQKYGRWHCLDVGIWNVPGRSPGFRSGCLTANGRGEHVKWYLTEPLIRLASPPDILSSRRSLALFQHG